MITDAPLLAIWVTKPKGVLSLSLAAMGFDIRTLEDDAGNVDRDASDYVARAPNIDAIAVEERAVVGVLKELRRHCGIA